MNTNKVRAIRRAKRTRAAIKGTKEMPRLSVYRSNNHIYAQLIDDTVAKTMLSISEKDLGKDKGARVSMAKELGVLLAKKAGEKKIKKAVFDRGSYRYHGRVKAFAEGVREGGLTF